MMNQLPVTSKDNDLSASSISVNPSEQCPLGPEFQGYWDLLSADERKMEFDPEGLYSLTVQDLALNIARLLPGDTVLDAFCGVGGNAIAFAREGKKVISIDSNLERLEMARRNAEKFGVASQIEFVHGDSLNYLSKNKCDAIFLDPPWGGPEYTQRKQFMLDAFSPNGRELLEPALQTAKYVAIKLPDNFNFEELEAFGRKYSVGEDRLNGRLLHYTAYFK